jgi:hypothetical protein
LQLIITLLGVVEALTNWLSPQPKSCCAGDLRSSLPKETIRAKAEVSSPRLQPRLHRHPKT